MIDPQIEMLVKVDSEILTMPVESVIMIIEFKS
jgi:hypothetical protein